MKWVKCKQEAVKRAMQGTGEHMNHPKWHRHQIWLLKRNWSSGFLSEIFKVKFHNWKLCVVNLFWKLTNQPLILPFLHKPCQIGDETVLSLVIEISQLINKNNDIIKNHYLPQWIAGPKHWKPETSKHDVPNGQHSTTCDSWAKKLNLNLIKRMINLPIYKK